MKLDQAKELKYSCMQKYANLFDIYNKQYICVAW